MTLALLSTTKLPSFLGDDHPDEESLFAEDDVLIGALAARGVTARRVPWRQRDVRWQDYDLVLVRSAWDYIDDLPGFLEVLHGIEAAGCRLVNPLETIRWNSDKRYLLALREAGLPMAPTAILEPGEDPWRDAQAALEKLGPCETGYVVKPLVGVGAFGAKRLPERTAALAELATATRSDPCLIQPYLTSVATEGEWSFVFGAGRFLYAALKTPKAGDFRVQVMYGARTAAKAPAAADLAAAEACLDALPVTAHVARIDMARLADGRLALMEAELIEPQLFFHDVPKAAGLVADAVLDLLGARSAEPA